jgi:stearoyl-CoA desaturase (delta-9 desaturase)
MLLKQDVKKIGFADISDLMKDPLIVFQHKYYALLSIFLGIVLPTYIASFWGDAMVSTFTKVRAYLTTS